MTKRNQSHVIEASHVQLSDSRQIGYQEYGDPEGSPVFFFHGWIGSRLDFAPNDDIARELNPGLYTEQVVD